MFADEVLGNINIKGFRKGKHILYACKIVLFNLHTTKNS